MKKVDRLPLSADISRQQNIDKLTNLDTVLDQVMTQITLADQDSAPATEENPLLNDTDDNTTVESAGMSDISKHPDAKYHDYRIKTYLNAEHYIYINGHKGTQHPHTFEFSVYVRFPGSKFIEFKELEDTFAKITAPYQNKCLNDISPFDIIIPTTENMTEIFAEQISESVCKLGGEVLQMTTSETPTRAYVVNFDTMKDLEKAADDFEDNALDDLIDARIDAVIRNNV